MGIMIIAARIAPFIPNVTIIQYLDFVLIFPPDSIIESSNMGSILCPRPSSVWMQSGRQR